jgi:capsular exopolysaccharide synthesis family protein
MLESREAALLEELRSIERDQERNQQLEVQLAELERQSEANRDHYEALLRRSKMTQEQQKSLLPQARIISLAVAPRSPSTPSPYVFAMVGFATSSMLGVGLGLVLERMNGRVRSVADLERALGLPVLGVAPRLPSRKARKYPARYIAQKPLSTMAESAFSILTSARSAKDGSEPVALLVTSALASEGKTTLSILLAATATALRYKTLLVELDLRRPTLNARLGAHADQPGLADYLLGELRRDQLIQRDPQSDIEYIPAGLPPALPPALLTGPKLRELIDSLRSEYTCIILDSAPVLAVTEARITSCLADRVILAARWRKSHVSAVIDAASALRQASSDIAGCVLTDVDTSKYRLDALDRGSYYSNSQRYYTN